MERIIIKHQTGSKAYKTEFFHWLTLRTLPLDGAVQ